MKHSLLLKSCFSTRWSNSLAVALNTDSVHISRVNWCNKINNCSVKILNLLRNGTANWSTPFDLGEREVCSPIYLVLLQVAFSEPLLLASIHTKKVLRWPILLRTTNSLADSRGHERQYKSLACKLWLCWRSAVRLRWLQHNHLSKWIDCLQEKPRPKLFHCHNQSEQLAGP